jgi:hypothetical protein
MAERLPEALANVLLEAMVGGLSEEDVGGATRGQWWPEDGDSSWRTTRMSEEDERGSRTVAVRQWLAGLMSKSGKRTMAKRGDTRDVCQQQWQDQR